MLVVSVGWLVVREVQDAANKRRAYPVIYKLGGRIGSLSSPIPFTGSELRIAFYQKEFSNDELQQLTVLNPLTSKHFVGVLFQDTNVTGDQIRLLRRQMPKCNIFRVMKGERLDNH